MFNECPPCPESIALDPSWFSDLQLDLVEKHGIVIEDKYQGSAKLIAHLNRHEKDVIHYSNLKYRHQLKVNITRLHRVISFQQNEIMKPSLEFKK